MSNNNDRGRRLTSIKVSFSKLLRKLRKVTLHKRNLVLQSHLLRVLSRPTNLEVVVVETNDLHVGEHRNFTSGSTDTTADVQDAHAWAELHLGGQIMFVSGKGSTEGFSLVEAGEMEGLSPAILVQLGYTVVVPIHDLGIVVNALVGVRILGEVVLVPEFGVILDSGLLATVCESFSGHCGGSCKEREPDVGHRTTL